MQITERELGWLNFYRASELQGGLVLGQLAQRVRDPYLLEQLTRHSAEEVMHADLWTRAIVQVGGRTRPVSRTYQSRYVEEIGAIGSVFQVLALTQVFERRVYCHFLEHERRPGTHPVVRATLRRMIEEEKEHLSWVKHWLDAERLRRGDVVRRTMARFEALDERVYRALIHEYGFSAGVPREGAA
jgi:rubrerythrin